MLIIQSQLQSHTKSTSNLNGTTCYLSLHVFPMGWLSVPENLLISHFLSRISHFYLASRIFFISHLAFLSRISHFFISHLAFLSRISHFLSRISHFLSRISHFYLAFRIFYLASRIFYLASCIFYLASCIFYLALNSRIFIFL